MAGPTTPPPYPSTDSMRTSFPPDVKVPPPPPPPPPSHPAPLADQASPLNNPFHSGSDEEAQWQSSLQNFEQQMISYQNNARDGGETEQESAERVAQAMENIADSHSDPKVKAQWRKTAKKFRKSQPKERENFVVAFLKGFLILLTLPFYIVGTIFHATGEIFDGMAFFLKTTGQLTKRLTYKGVLSSNADHYPRICEDNIKHVGPSFLWNF